MIIVKQYLFSIFIFFALCFESFAADIELLWSTPTTKTDGSELLPEDIVAYDIWMFSDVIQNEDQMIKIGDNVVGNILLTSVNDSADYCFAAVTIARGKDGQKLRSEFSEKACIKVEEPLPESPTIINIQIILN